MRKIIAASAAWVLTFTMTYAADTSHGPSDAWAHASQYGDPNHYLGPALYDIYTEIFHSRSLQTSSQQGTFRTTISCYQENCLDDTPYVCADDTSIATGIDTNGDGSSEIVPGDVVYIGDPYAVNARPPRARTHVVAAIVRGNGSNGCTGSQKRVEVLGRIRSREESLASGMYVVNAWSNWAHPTTGALYLVGRQLGYASRMFGGLQGPNLVANGDCTFLTPPLPANWETDSAGHPLTQQGYPQTNPTTDPANCINGGSGLGDCMTYASPLSGSVFTTALVPLTPGASYSLSAWALPGTSAENPDYLVLADSGGTEIPGSRLALTPSLIDQFGGTAHYVYHGIEVPPGVTTARVVYEKVDPTPGRPWLDDVAVRQVFSHGLDTSGQPSQSFLVNDPGSRTVLYTGDSWADSTYGQGLTLGLANALSERFGRDFTTQIVWSGMSGDTTSDLLQHWDERVSPYDPLYCIFSIGTNDILVGLPEGQFVSNLQAIVHRSRCAGCVPIFIGISPVCDSSGGHRTTAYRYRELERSVLADYSIAPPGSVTGLMFEDPEMLVWTAPADATTFDVVRGDVSSLRASSGDFARANCTCLGQRVADTTATDESRPDGGTGFFYLVRARDCVGVPGTWGGDGAVGSRDTGIAACP